jgi:hypothetical protein
MTTREKIHKLVDELPESQLDPVAEFIATRGRPDDVVDEWGNVSAMLRGSTVRSMRRLDEQEQRGEPRQCLVVRATGRQAPTGAGYDSL